MTISEINHETLAEKVEELLKAGASQKITASHIVTELGNVAVIDTAGYGVLIEG